MLTVASWCGRVSPIRVPTRNWSLCAQAVLSLLRSTGRPAAKPCVGLLASADASFACVCHHPQVACTILPRVLMRLSCTGTLWVSIGFFVRASVAAPRGGVIVFIRHRPLHAFILSRSPSVSVSLSIAGRIGPVPNSFPFAFTSSCWQHVVVGTMLRWLFGKHALLVTRSIRNAGCSCLTSGSTRRVPRLGLGLLSTRLCGTRGLTWALGRKGKS